MIFLPSAEKRTSLVGPRLPVGISASKVPLDASQIRTAPELLGPWGEATLVMENLGGQRSYNPRFVPGFTREHSSQYVYWTATYDAYDESWPMHGRDFDYNVFLYQTDLAAID